MKNLINRALAAEKKLYHLLTILILLITAVSFQSCGNEKYTVWTETETYSEFQSAFQSTLSDGYYKRLEISNEQWEQIAPYLTSEGKHKWSEEEIKKWLIGCGFGQTEATKESSWLAMVDHGFIAMRDQNLVYMILK